MMIEFISSDKYLTLEAIRAANKVAPIANEATYIDLLLSTYCAAIIEAAIEAKRDAALSALLVTTTGTFPPTINPAAHAPIK